ncbi:MAG: hypothetical protein IMZ58_12405 [Thermoplasmata archaeon]|nr:hypothetical protein [Thermoplasmata archaeon]
MPKKIMMQRITMYVTIIALIAFLFTIVLYQTGILAPAILSSNAKGRITGMLSIPSEVLPGQTVTVRVLVFNDGEEGQLNCKWVNNQTGEQLAEQSIPFPADRGATFTSSITVPSAQMGSFIVCAYVSHDSALDDTRLLVMPISIVGHRVFIKVLDNKTHVGVAGAEVNLGAEQKNTNAVGEVIFVTSPGTYGIFIHHPDYWNYGSRPGEDIIVSNSDITKILYINLFKEGTDETQPHGIPGFEVPIFIISIGAILLLIRRKKHA